MPGDLRRGRSDLRGVAPDPARLVLVHGGAVDLRLVLIDGLFRLVRRIKGVGGHMVKALGAVLRRFDVAPGPLIVSLGEAPHAGLPVDPAVQAALIEDLPGLRLDGLAGHGAADLDAFSEEVQDPVRPGLIEDPGEIIGPLPLQVVQVPLTRQDLPAAAVAPEPALGHLLGIDAHGMVEPAALSHLSHRKAGPSAPWPRRGPATGPASCDRRA